MATDRALFDELSKVVQANVPRFSNRWKLQVWKNLAVAAILWPFNKRFLTSYITTFYPNVDWPRESYADEEGTWETLSHEYVHLFDRKRWSVLFSLAYLFPQSLAVLALLAVGGIWFKPLLLCLVFLLCLLPWPAPGRVWAEKRGYTMSMAVRYWRHQESPEHLVDAIVPQFIGWPYFKMSWKKPDAMRAELLMQAEAITSGRILEGAENLPFRRVRDLLDRMGALHRG